MQDQILTYELNVGVTVNINIVDFMKFFYRFKPNFEFVFIEDSESFKITTLIFSETLCVIN